MKHKNLLDETHSNLISHHEINHNFHKYSSPKKSKHNVHVCHKSPHEMKPNHYNKVEFLERLKKTSY